MARRAVALGVGLIVLILLVFGAKGCLDARKNRSLEDYAGTVTQIVDETNALSNTFFNRLEDPKDLGQALRRAIAVVKKGEPALIDVMTQGR